jgi:Mn2+/Fe2+ NRAMP family transporter
MLRLKELGVKEFPRPLPLRNLIGPSFIILGVGLGSGELILWPYLAANFGLGIIWAAIIGITFQFILNMEIQRYTLVTGESIFVGLARKFGRFTPMWFIISTFVPWMWPGIAAASAKLIAASLGMEYSGIFGIVLLLIMGVLFSLGSVVYKTQEQIQKAIILVGVPFVFLVTIITARVDAWGSLAAGVIGRGEGYWLFPEALPIATFLAAFAYAGAGGNLNLAQSLYAREKGYGMGKYAAKITNIFANGPKQAAQLEGYTFQLNSENIENYKIWWKRINIEHALIFWITGAFTMILLSVLAYSTVYGKSGVETSINFVIHEAGAIGEKTIPALGTFFMGMAALMLFGTQFSVFGSNSRIMSENLVISDQKKFPVEHLSKYFYFFLWFQIAAGILIFALGFTEPLGLVVLGAVFNAISMFIYTGLVTLLNTTRLAKPLRPGTLRRAILTIAFLFYGGFSLFTVLQKLGIL